MDWDISDDNPYMFQPKRSGDPGLVPGGKEMKEHTLSGALLAWYDFGARQYDPVLGRWHARDPANQFASPYVAMGNDPVNSTDPTGLFATRMEEYYDPPNNKWNNNALTYPGSGSESSGSSYANDYIDPYGRSLAEEHLAAIDEWMEMTGHGLSVYCGYSSLWEMKVSQARGYDMEAWESSYVGTILSGYEESWLAGSAQFRAVMDVKRNIEEAKKKGGSYTYGKFGSNEVFVWEGGTYIFEGESIGAKGFFNALTSMAVASSGVGGEVNPNSYYNSTINQIGINITAVIGFYGGSYEIGYAYNGGEGIFKGRIYKAKAADIYGFDASIGIISRDNVSKKGQKLNLEDLKGFSNDIAVGIGPIDIGFGTPKNGNDKFLDFSGGKYWYQELGVSVGSPVGFTITRDSFTELMKRLNN